MVGWKLSKEEEQEKHERLKGDCHYIVNGFSQSVLRHKDILKGIGQFNCLGLPHGSGDCAALWK